MSGDRPGAEWGNSLPNPIPVPDLARSRGASCAKPWIENTSLLGLGLSRAAASKRLSCVESRTPVSRCSDGSPGVRGLQARPWWQPPSRKVVAEGLSTPGQTKVFSRCAATVPCASRLRGWFHLRSSWTRAMSAWPLRSSPANRRSTRKGRNGCLWCPGSLPTRPDTRARRYGAEKLPLPDSSE